MGLSVVPAPSSLGGAAVVLMVGMLVVLGGVLILRADAGGSDGDGPQMPQASRQSQFPADSPQLSLAHATISHCLAELAAQSDQILQEAALVKVVEIQEELRALAAGKVVFTATEAWRMCTNGCFAV